MSITTHPRMEEDRAAWLALRRTFLGATDVVALLKLRPLFVSERSIYLTKKGLIDEKPMTEAMYWGIAQEPIVAQRYADDTGSEIAHSNVYIDEEHHIGCSPDYITFSENVTQRLLEIKTTNAWSGKENFGNPNTDQIPDAYIAQCVWQMGITGIHEADLAVLIGGNDFRIYHIPWDSKLFGVMVAKAISWWATYMEADFPPPISTLDVDSDYLDDAADLLPPDSVVAATPEIEDIIVELARVKEALTGMKEAEKLLGNKLKDYLVASKAIILTTPLYERPITWKERAGVTKVDWPGILTALAVDVPDDMKMKYTTVGKPTRVFRFPGGKEE